MAKIVVQIQFDVAVLGRAIALMAKGYATAATDIKAEILAFADDPAAFVDFVATDDAGLVVKAVPTLRLRRLAGEVCAHG